MVEMIGGEAHPTEGERAIRATISGAILGVLLALFGRTYPAK
jgi:hypothetical protein